MSRRRRARLAAELREHADDLTDEGVPVTDEHTRLGDPAAVAAAAADQYRRAAWSRRHPLVAYGLLPLPAVAGWFATVLLLEAAAAAAFERPMAGLSRPALNAAVGAFAWALAVVPFAAAALYARLAARTAAARGWLLVAVGQIAAVAGLFVSRVHASDVAGQSTWEVGVSWLAGGSRPGWPQLLQLAVPLALGAWLARRRPVSAAVAQA